MTAIEEKVAALKAKALARGIDIDKPQRKPPAARPIKPREATKPSTPRQRAAFNRLPSVANRPWGGAHAAIKVRMAAGLVALCLGEGWRREYEGHYLCIVHPDGPRLKFSKAWGGDRFSITPIDCHSTRQDALPESITVDATRSPASIARDIENRLISHGLFEGHQAVKERRQADRREKVAERLKMLRVAKAMQAKIAAETVWSRFDYRPVTTTVNTGKVSAFAHLSYSGRICIEIGTFCPEIAEQIVRFATSFAGENQ